MPLRTAHTTSTSAVNSRGASLEASMEQDGMPLLSRSFADEKKVPWHYDDPTAGRRRRQWSHVAITSVCSSLATALIIGLAAMLLYQRGMIVILTSNTPFVYDDYFNVTSSRATGCGNSVEEAIASGCSFDELSDLWLPPKCSRAFEQEYLRTNDGKPPIYWAKPDGKELVSNRSQYAGGATYYSTTRDHLLHCEYNFYRFADSLKTGARVGHADGFADHFHHCAHILGKFANMAPNIDNIDVDTISTFGYC